MKLNLLILSLIGVSVSASGIRGFVPIKGSDRRLATSKSSSSSKSSSGGGKAVAELVKSMSRNEGTDCQLTLTRSELHALTATTGKSSTSKSKRRLVSSSKSKSSTSTDADFRTIEVDGCTYEVITGPSKSTSKSKDRRRLTKTTTNTSSKSKNSGGGYRMITLNDDTTVRCVGNSERCHKCHTNSRARLARNFAFSSGSKSKGSSKSNRRLAPTSKSSSKSSSYDDDADLLVRYGKRCQIREVWIDDFDSSSTSSSKSKGR